MLSRALLTDLYEVTMAHGYWAAGKAADEAIFHLYFRSEPFDGGYAIAAGLESAIKYLEELAFTSDDLAYLRSLEGSDGRPLLRDEFLAYLRDLRFTCEVDAIPEGTVVFANEPLVRVRGPIIEAQLVESALLNMINFETLIATKASRVVHAAQGDPVVEFGLRRAQGNDGAVSAARAAYVGGVKATSNLLAAATHSLPTAGTHAHSWVMAFDSEEEAFDAYAEAMPNNVLLLLDTYDTVEGVRHAIATGKKLRARGRDLVGVRLDSGDLAKLSIEVRRILDEAGFPKAIIAASNELDEMTIFSLKEQKARIDLWGVGTKLITAWGQPALGGVYKLTALRRKGGEWTHRVKFSENPAKTTTPGSLQVRRFVRGSRACADTIFDELLTQPESQAEQHEDLLVPVFRNSRRIYELPTMKEICARRESDLAQFDPAVKRLAGADRYPVLLEKQLANLKARLVAR